MTDTFFCMTLCLALGLWERFHWFPFFSDKVCLDGDIIHAEAFKGPSGESLVCISGLVSTWSPTLSSLLRSGE